MFYLFMVLLFVVENLLSIFLDERTNEVDERTKEAINMTKFREERAREKERERVCVCV